MAHEGDMGVGPAIGGMALMHRPGVHMLIAKPTLEKLPHTRHILLVGQFPWPAENPGGAEPSGGPLMPFGCGKKRGWIPFRPAR
jgi:hypothetical protein